MGKDWIQPTHHLDAVQACMPCEDGSELRGIVASTFLGAVVLFVLLRAVCRIRAVDFCWWRCKKSCKKKRKKCAKSCCKCMRRCCIRWCCCLKCCTPCRLCCEKANKPDQEKAGNKSRAQRRSIMESLRVKLKSLVGLCPSVPRPSPNRRAHHATLLPPRLPSVPTLTPRAQAWCRSWRR